MKVKLISHTPEPEKVIAMLFTSWDRRNRKRFLKYIKEHSYNKYYGGWNL